MSSKVPCANGSRRFRLASRSRPTRWTWPSKALAKARSRFVACARMCAIGSLQAAAKVSRVQYQGRQPLFTRAIFGLAISRDGSLIRHGELANALARRRKDRVGQRRGDRRGSGLADPSRSLAALHDVNLDRRRLAHPQHLVIVEIALHDTTVLQRDLSTESRGDAEDDSALELRLDRIRIDDGAAIDRAHDAPDANCSVLRHLDFGNLRHIGGEGVLDRDAATDALRQWLS